MSWHYRVVKDGANFSLCEVYYDLDNKVMGRTDPVCVDKYESRKEVVRELEMMLADAKKHKTLSVTA